MDIAIVASARCPARYRNVGIVRSGGELLGASDLSKMLAVFVDFGVLPDGLTGPRVARRLRREGFEGGVYLLTDCREPTQVQWSVSNGATDVILRTSQSMEAVLPQLVALREFGSVIELPAMSGGPVEQDGQGDSFASWQHTDAAIVVTRALNEVVLGPAASIAVLNALKSWRQERCEPPTVKELAQMCVRHVRTPDARARYWQLCQERV